MFMIGRHGGFRDTIGYDEVDAIPGNLATQDAGSEARKQIGNCIILYYEIIFYSLTLCPVLFNSPELKVHGELLVSEGESGIMWHQHWSSPLKLWSYFLQVRS